MREDEITRILRENEGNEIIVETNDGECMKVQVLHVDSEGFTGYLLDSPEGDATEALWFAFEYIDSVRTTLNR